MVEQTKHNQYYQKLKDQTAECISHSLADEFNILHAEIHHTILDFEEWLSIMQNRPEYLIFEFALRELHSSLFAVLLAQYRHAFMSLRLFLELGLACIYFSAHEYLLRLWLSGNNDLNWKQLINNDSGVFSKQFATAFTPSLSDDSAHYGSLAEKVYRECSEFIHGNRNTFKTLPASIQFDEPTFRIWFEKAKTIRLVLTFALTIRYLGTIDKEQVEKIELVILDEVGFHEAVRLTVNARKGE